MGWSSLGSQQRIAVLLDLIGGPQYSAKITAAGRATAAFGGTLLATARATRTASRQSFLYRQELYTMRRYTFLATTAFLGLAYGVAKLGYGYLSTRDAARASLSPILVGLKAQNAELDRLFYFSKYSPFVLKDMTKAFAVMYPALHNAGLGVGEINQLLLSMTNFLSQSLRTTPQALNQISYAIQHMLYQGRLTGRLTQSLAAAGVPIPMLLEKLGYAHANLSSIARLNISPKNVIRALTEMGQEGIFKDAARRQALKSLPGMFQVLSDSLGQLIGQASENRYNKFKANMSQLVGPGGFLDKLSKSKNAGDAVAKISQGLTGGTSAGRGFLILVDTLTQLARIFMNAVIPAFKIALAILAPFALLLIPINFGLKLLADHAWLVKYALVPLAAYFIFTTTAMIGMWVTSKFLTLATFGQIGALKKLAIVLFTVNGRMKLINALQRLYIILTKGEIVFTNFYGKAVAVQYTRIELLAIRIRARIVAMALAARASWISMLGPIGLVIAGLLLIIKYHDKIERWSGAGVSTDPSTGKTKHHPGTILGVPIGDWWNPFSGGSGIKKSVSKAVSPITTGKVDQVSAGSLEGFNNQKQVQIHQLVVDRKVLAQAVSRENNDRQARR